MPGEGTSIAMMPQQHPRQIRWRPVQAIKSEPTPVVAKEAKVAEEVLASARLQTQRLSELRDNELLWFRLVLFLQPPPAPRHKIQAAAVRTQQEDNLRDG